MIIRLPLKATARPAVYIAARPGGEKEAEDAKQGGSILSRETPGEISRNYSSKFVELSYRGTSRRGPAHRDVELISISLLPIPTRAVIPLSLSLSLSWFPNKEPPEKYRRALPLSLSLSFSLSLSLSLLLSSIE